MNTQVKNTLPPVALLLDSNRGVYIPQHFVTQFDLTKWQGIKPDDVEVLKAGPHGEGFASTEGNDVSYWDAWQSTLDSATLTDNGNTWRLYQDGDLWALCPELMTDEEKHNFGFDE